ncbi:DUF2764 family protein [Treponema pedis]|uniref:DUF2764 family protein n=2 Tax=Treponema pedis TaxID=409322 RepID=S6A8K7_9SPIR|nr:DUF2764 family protein [Treponema pedis]AGT43999.1 hypothetical protein TPE_1504 [Treponema pedis str. T A4]QOW61844.1 DUF2764 family protein [Treponema pedis]QSI04730.1 DUF2764 family protein [Treponema pedis]
MASYYYLTAQLPSIQASSQAPMSFKAFKELALRFLTEKDAAILNKLSLEPPRSEEKTGSAFLDNWYGFERSLRLALEQARALKLKWESSISYEERLTLSGAFSPMQSARAAVAMQNPLEAENFLDNVRFQAADTVRGSDGFSSDAVFSYAIKLLLRERASKFDMERGREEYSHLYHEILGEKRI